MRRRPQVRQRTVRRAATRKDGDGFSRGVNVGRRYWISFSSAGMALSSNHRVYPTFAPRSNTKTRK